jgi:hypothetical protein
LFDFEAEKRDRAANLIGADAGKVDVVAKPVEEKLHRAHERGHGGHRELQVDRVIQRDDEGAENGRTHSLVSVNSVHPRVPSV